MSLKQFFTLICFLLIFVNISAEVPNTINYQGRLTDSSGDPVADAAYLVKFIIYDAAISGTDLWNSGFQTINTVGGLFSYQLGSIVSLPNGIFADTNRYLGVTVDTDPELLPRTRFITTSYAFNSQSAELALDSDSLGGSQPAFYLDWNNMTNIPADIADGDDVNANPAWSSLTGVPAGFADGTDNVGTGDISGVTAGSGLSGGGTSGNVTLNLAPTVTSSHTFNGGTISFGDSTMNIGNNGVRIGDGGTPSDSFLVFSKRNYNSPWNRFANYIDIDNQSSGSLYGTFINVGAFDDVGGNRTGVYTKVDNLSTSVNDLFGIITDVGRTFKTAGVSYGVFTKASAGTGSQAFGIWAEELGAGPNYAGYFMGRVHVNGNLSKSSGSFKIDHPLDPENKYLQHSFVESPDMMNIYNGNVNLDENGEAIIEMPNYFTVLNMDFRYQLTAIGSPGPNLYIAEKISNNRFSIAGGESFSEVSWQVTGIRNDKYAQAHRIQVEVVKPSFEIGTYLHPEEHGQPIERHANWKQMKEGMERRAEDNNEQ